MEAVAKEFVKNKYGIAIVKCCASCIHHSGCRNDDYRTCLKDRREHHMEYLCKDGWEMTQSLENAGKGGGRVKKKAYIDFVLKNGFSHMEEFEKQYGNKYLTKK